MTHPSITTTSRPDAETPPLPGSELQPWLRRLAVGDPQALAWLFDQYAPLVHATAYRLTRSSQDAEDLVQELFLSLPARARRYDARGSFEGWLRTVTARLALTALRRRAGQREELLDDWLPAHGRQDADAIDRIALEHAIARLPDGLRAVLLLREEGFDHREIAELLSIRVGTSEVRLFRARQLLRELLGDHR